MVTQRFAEKRAIAGPDRMIVVLNLSLEEPPLRETSHDITVLGKSSLKHLFHFMLSIFFIYFNGWIVTENIFCQPSSFGEIITSNINDAKSLPIFKLNKVKNVKGKMNLPMEKKCLHVWRVGQQG